MGIFGPDIEQLEDDGDVDGLVRALDHRRAVIRLEAIEALDRLGDPRSLEPLFGVSDDRDWRVRVAALEAMSAHRDKRAISRLIERLEDPKPRVRQAAVDGLRYFDDERIAEPLIERLGDYDLTVARNTANILSELKETEAVEPMLELFERSKQVMDHSTSALVADSLGHLGDDRAMEPLIECLDREEGRIIRIGAALALGKLRAPAALDPLLKLLKDKDLFVCKAALGALQRMGDTRAIPALTGMLDDPAEDIRQNAARSIVELGKGDERAARTLEKAGFKVEARWLLRDVEALVRMLEDETTRISAIEALVDLGDRRAIEPLIELLDDHEPRIRLNAAARFCRMTDERAVDPLLSLLDDPDEQIRTMAVTALVFQGDPGAIETLREVSMDDSKKVMKLAKLAVRKLSEGG